MKIRNQCGCGLENYTMDDWLAHWIHGRSKIRAIILLFKTKIWVEK